MRRPRAGGPFDISIGGAGAFPSAGRPRALWLDVRAASRSSSAWRRRSTAALRDAGWAIDAKPLRAHLTLARADGVAAGAAIGARLVAAAADLDVTIPGGSRSGCSRASPAADLPATSRSRSRCWADRAASGPSRAPVLPSSRGGRWTPATCALGEPRIHVSGTQRLRLVLALGVVNLVLATVALGDRAVGAGSDPGRGAGPDLRDRPSRRRPRPRRRRRPDRRRRAAPAVEPDTRRPPCVRESGARADAGTTDRAVARSLGQPSPVPSAPVVTQADRRGDPGADRGRATPGQPGRRPGRPAPAAGKPPHREPTPSPTKAPVPTARGTPPACHARSAARRRRHGKACHDTSRTSRKKDHHDNGRHRGAAPGRPDGRADRQPAIAETRPASKTRHRLRSGRRAR